MRRIGLVVALAGCNQVYDLGPTVKAVAVDTDQDRIPDVHDNCPAIANPEQIDEDQDSFGDACDNCPLIANAAQEAIGDGDAFGDLCDPHPVDDGDCLLVQDTFADPTTFATHWQVTTPEVSPDVRPSPGEVAITPILFVGGIAVVSRDVPTGERLDVIAVGRFDALSPDSGAAVGAVTNYAAMDDGFRCELKNGSRGLVVIAGLPNVGAASRPLSTAPVGSAIIFRLASDRTPTGPMIHCRIDYGIAAGAVDNGFASELTAGGTGVMTLDDPLVLEAIAISRFQPGQPCPTPIIR